MDWATTKHSEGLALWELGRGESGIIHLREAADAFGAALKEWTRERVPLDYQKAQDGLGRVQALLKWRLNTE